jgi:hypothetical protein
MAAPRRRVIRPQAVVAVSHQQRQRQIQRLRDRLGREQLALKRWQKRLRRAFNAVDKQNRVILRIETQIARTEESSNGSVGR